ncbi:MAG: transketolase [Spirochaetia bacterium]|nr:transketolase [Spirochaetia bacterium]
MNSNHYAVLEEKAKGIRMMILEQIAVPGTGHVGGSFSAVEALVALYNGIMKIDPLDPHMESRDRFVLSKGHAGPGLYAVLAERGYFDRKMLLTLNQSNTNLPSHADMNRTPGVDMTTGSLGQGISCAVGMAYASRLRKDGATIYCMVGDGEAQEGQVWEAAMFASHQKLDHLIAFTDYNKMQIDGTTEQVLDLGDIEEKWNSFGWHTLRIDGHDMQAIEEAIQKAKEENGKPSMIILDTIKGKGASFCEGKVTNHNMAYDLEVANAAIKELL